MWVARARASSSRPFNCELSCELVPTRVPIRSHTLTNGGVCRMRRMPPVSRLAPRTDGGKTERESGHAQYTYGNRIEWHPIC